MRHLSIALCVFTMAAGTAFVPGVAPVAQAQQADGIPITFRVLDIEGKPIPTAVIRHPDEMSRHRVNAETGEAPITELYMPDGSQVVFQKGDRIPFEVSAPGYNSVSYIYEVKKRRNLVIATLEKMNIDALLDDEGDDPVIQFGRDKPID